MDDEEPVLVRRGAVARIVREHPRKADERCEPRDGAEEEVLRCPVVVSSVNRPFGVLRTTTSSPGPSL